MLLRTTFRELAPNPCDISLTRDTISRKLYTPHDGAMARNLAERLSSAYSNLEGLQILRVYRLPILTKDCRATKSLNLFDHNPIS